MNMKLDVIKSPFALFLMFFLVLIFIVQTINFSYAKTLYTYDTLDLRMMRYWQGLNKPFWIDWSVDYAMNIAQTHDDLYNSTQNSGKGGYFKADGIKIRPLIVWFAYNNGSVDTPKVIVSSGSDKYDSFYCSVISKTKVPAFPETKNRIFMWDGELADVIVYLKNKGVLPVDYQLNNPNFPYQLNWEKI